MRVLYAIQGTGNGHLSRAREIVPLLKQIVETDVLVSGYQADVELPFKVNYRKKGLSFIFGKKGGVDIGGTFLKSNLFRLFKEVFTVPVKKYDLVINDFEPVTAWACLLKGVKCISLSHQAVVLAPNAPKPSRKNWVGFAVLKYYAPVKQKIGFHFKPYDESTFTPVIRKDIRALNTSNKGFYLVYLPAYSDEIMIKVLGEVKGCQWHVFSKHTKKEQQVNNVWIRPINNNQFVADLAACEGVLCGAGFEAPAEALYLKKKLMVIPMKYQYEQECNAAALANLGVPVLSDFNMQQVEAIQRWTNSQKRVEVYYPDETQNILAQLLIDYLDIKNHTSEEKLELAI